MKRIVTLAGALMLSASLSACALVDRFMDREPEAMADAPGQV